MRSVNGFRRPRPDGRALGGRSGASRPAISSADLLRLAARGVRSRKLRAALSALGIAIGVAAIVAVLGLSSSSQAGLLAQIDRLGTNLLTASNGQDFTGQQTELPTTAPASIARLEGVQEVEDTGTTSAHAYRNDRIPLVNTNSLTVRAASLGLPKATATTMAQGRWLDAATARLPTAVLGAVAAKRLGIVQLQPDEIIWVGGRWFTVIGILHAATLTPEIDTSVLVGYPAAESYLDFDGNPSVAYVRTDTDRVGEIHDILANAANPTAPNEVDVSQPSDALEARAQAAGAFNGLFLGLGAVSLLVGAVGVANIMIISVLERRSEIGLRRALGATRPHIRVQFLVESLLLALAGGVVGLLAGVTATAIYAISKDWQIVVPAEAWIGGLVSSLVIGAIAGLVPALRAARLPPTQALWAA